MSLHVVATFGAIRRVTRREEQRRYRARLRETMGEAAYLARRAEEMRAYRSGGSPRLYASRTEAEREKARRKRARRHARGLTSDGTPVVRPDLQAVQLARFECPQGCICRDCLFPPAPYFPRVVRAHHV